MDWLEQNLDAYRIIAEILTDLREVLRDKLEELHGKEWYKVGLPNGLLDQLVEIKEKERAIDWYESEYQQVMNYAVFPDLLQILEMNSETFPTIVELAPTAALLHARFLELEVMRSKLGRARPISDTELAFLGTFHLRFRRAIDEFRTSKPGEIGVREEQKPVEPPPPLEEATEPVATPESTAPVAAPVADSKPTVAQDLQPEPDEPPAPAEPEEDEAQTAAQHPPQRPVQAPAEAAEADTPGSPETDRPETASEEPDAPAAEATPQEGKTPTFDDALESGDDPSILRAIYQEVTKTAEGIWTKDVIPNTQIWDKVRISNWYEESFSRLGLKPISDFYEIISKVDSKMREGSSKEELQNYLKQSNFAQILLALRDMFQSHQI